MNMRTQYLSASVLLAALTLSLGAAAPGPPTNLVGVVSGNTVSLTWQAPAIGQPVTYVVEAALSPGGAVVANLTVVANTINVPSVPNGVYYVRVRALDLSGPSEPSNEVIIVVPGGGGGSCTTAPNAPQGLFGSTLGTIVLLNWNAPVGGCPATQYAVQAGSGPGLSNITVANVGALTGLTSNAPVGTYYIRVVSLNAFGGSIPSTEIVLNVGLVAPPPAPVPPPTPPPPPPPPPTNTCGPVVAACGQATARCNNGSYSCSQNRSGTCSSNGGVACWICPGLLCQ